MIGSNRQRVTLQVKMISDRRAHKAFFFSPLLDLVSLHGPRGCEVVATVVFFYRNENIHLGCDFLAMLHSLIGIEPVYPVYV